MGGRCLSSHCLVHIAQGDCYQGLPELLLGMTKYWLSKWLELMLVNTEPRRLNIGPSQVQSETALK